jgi:hypothetical protein
LNKKKIKTKIIILLTIAITSIFIISIVYSDIVSAQNSPNTTTFVYIIVGLLFLSSLVSTEIREYITTIKSWYQRWLERKNINDFVNLLMTVWLLFLNMNH